MMNNRRDMLKALALLPLAACTRPVDNSLLPGAIHTVPSVSGWQPDDKQLNLQKVKITRVKAIPTAPFGTELVIVKV